MASECRSAVPLYPNRQRSKPTIGATTKASTDKITFPKKMIAITIDTANSEPATNKPHLYEWTKKEKAFTDKYKVCSTFVSALTLFRDRMSSLTFEAVISVDSVDDVL